MNQVKIIVVLMVGFLLMVVGSSAFYSVNERQRAIITRFGKVQVSDDSPGLHVKMPFIEEVHYFDKRILTLDSEPQEYLTKEKKTLVVDSFVKWRIINTLDYFLSVGGDQDQANANLQQLVSGGLRDQFGKRNLSEVVSGARSKIMTIIQKSTNEAAAKYGIEVVDVRLKRVDLKASVSKSVFDRMNSERKRIASELRAKGEASAEKLRADADRQRTEMLAIAYRKAEQVRGKGDARATAIFARAFNRNPEFYSLYRSLKAYRESFKDKDDIMIVDPSSDFFKYLKNSGRK
ncbi:MAG: protease modulator HflC [Gammaproteobacteria bacterium]|nr:protease modulator HflC [Gammaproteobacteria bacterium]